MLLRAWAGWGVFAFLAGSLAASARPPELPAKPTVNGKATAPLTQDFYQVEPPPAASQALPPVRERHHAPPIANPVWNRLVVWFIKSV